jgi:hypothetical protein
MMRAATRQMRYSRHRSRRRRGVAYALVAAMSAPACARETPEAHELRVWGEAFVEDKIPATEVVDGWEIEFDEFVVAIGEIVVTADDEVEVPGWHVFDLTAPTNGDGQLLAEFEAVGPLRRVDYRLGRVRGDVVGGNATMEQIDALLDDDYGLHVRGRARRDGEEIAFDWRFAMDYGHACELDQDIATPAPSGPTLTIHADHLLVDDFEVDPNVAFDAIADAEANSDAIVTPQELADVDITGFARYQTGSRELRDLWTYIGTLAGTLGHVDGEGGCSPAYVPRDYVGVGEPATHGAGEALYTTHCASCHGATGQGDGPVSSGWPRPTNLTLLTASALDPDYLFYRVREGGAFFPYHSTMTAFPQLSDDEVRAIVGHVLAWNH